MTDPTVTDEQIEAARIAVLAELGQIERTQPWGVTDAEADAIGLAALLAAARVQPAGQKISALVLAEHIADMATGDRSALIQRVAEVIIKDREGVRERAERQVEHTRKEMQEHKARTEKAEAERERCARIAHEIADQTMMVGPIRALAFEIAAAIRAGESEGRS